MSSSRLRPAASVPNSGSLPPDALFEVLLRVPAKDLCRLRAVCRCWRALTVDPQFAAAHKSRHTEPHFATTFRDGDARGVVIVDLSGQVLRRIRVTSVAIRFLPACVDRICITRECKPALGAWVVNPATGAALSLPGRRPEELLDRCRDETYDWGHVVMHNCATVTYALGQVISTRDYKVTQPLLCDIITLDENTVGRWRRKPNPPGRLMRVRGTMESLALNGVLYFLYDAKIMESGSIASFNLETEEWMPILRGPQPLRSLVFHCYGVIDRMLSLANLNGCLVTVDSVRGANTDLWFLEDSERSLWVKKYRLTVQQLVNYVYPLLVLGNGSVLFKPGVGPVQTYNPTTGTSTTISEMRIGDSESISVYTGSLLI